jgi:hypothetical protein
MTIFSEALFPFVSSDFVSFSFLSARHSFTIFKLISMLQRPYTACYSFIITANNDFILSLFPTQQSPLEW